MESDILKQKSLTNGQVLYLLGGLTTFVFSIALIYFSFKSMEKELDTIKVSIENVNGRVDRKHDQQAKQIKELKDKNNENTD